MENMDNGKIRVNANVQIDTSTEKLIEDLYYSYFMLGVLIIILSVFFKQFYVAFAYFLYFLSFKFQKNLAPKKTKEELTRNLGLISNDNINSKNKYAVHLGTLVKKHKKDVDILTFINKIRKSMGLSYIVEQTIPSQKLTASKANAITPVLMNDAILREHCSLMATSGGGKTELLINGFIDSSISNGSGILGVLGKADNIMLQRIQSICVQYNTLSELLVFDFNPDKQGKFHSNTINIFELGASKDIITLMTNIADLEENDSDGWNAKAKKYLNSILKILLVLRDANFFVDVSKIDEIYNSTNKYEQYQKYIVKLDYFGFYKLLSEVDLLIKFLLIFDEMYKTNRIDLNNKLYENNTKMIEINSRNNSSLSHLDNSVKNQFHNELKDTIIMLSTVPDWDKLSEAYIHGVKTDNDTIYGYEAITLKYSSRSGTFYELGIAQNLLVNLIKFFDSFAPILKNVNSDINILDAIDSNKIVIINLPGQNKVYAPVLAELIISSLNLLSERRGKDYIPDTTTLVILDEINSWLKTKNQKSYGLGDILSVIRGLYMGAVLSFQSDTKETMGSVDNSQIIANVKTHITLKNEDVELIKLLNEKVSKVDKYEVEETLEKTQSTKKTQQEKIKVIKKEEDFFKPEMLSSIKNGEGYIIRNSIAQPFMSKFLIQESLYETSKDEIRLNRYVPESKILEKRTQLLNEIKKNQGN